MSLSNKLTSFIDWFYRPPFTAIPRQTFRYLACGGINWAVTTVCFWIAFNFVFAKRNVDLGSLVVASHTAALGIAVPISFLLGFWMQKNVSFQGSPLRGRVQLFRYFVSGLAAALVTWLLEKLLVEAWHIFPTVAFTIIYLTTALGQFLIQKHYTFRGAAK
jgi:putative flippase GtrA